MLRNNLMLPTEALGIPEAIDFDGTNDYLSRASDLTGNADGKTFTFSAWVWFDAYTTNHSLYLQSSSGDTTWGVDAFVSNGAFIVNCRNSASTEVFRCTLNDAIPLRTTTHLLLSVDLSNTSNRFLYVNDVLRSPTWTTYTNSAIDLTQQYHGIGASGATGVQKVKARLAHVFLAYEYIDLSIEANRRLFITADRKPAANQQALNPILYLPLNDPTQPGKNLGTGGDFNLTGVVARSGRGPNQYNAPYSTFDGSADYLSTTSISVSTKTFTLSFCISAKDTATYPIVFTNGSTSYRFYATLYPSGVFGIVGKNSTGTSILSISGGTYVATSVSRNMHLCCSVDLTDTNKCHVYLNGEAQTVTQTFYTNAFISLLGAQVGVNSSLAKQPLIVGAIYFDTSYIDLSQPANLAKFVTGTGIDAKPVDLGANGELPTGTSPLIYLPMYGNNAGKNYGTGGDFTVNSGPYPGARGPNEFWGNVLQFAGAYSYRTSALTGAIDSKTFTFVGWFSAQASTTGTTAIDFYSTNSGLRIGMNNGGPLSISGTNIYATVNSPNPAIYANDIGRNSMYCIMISVDLTDTAKRNVYINGISQSTTWTTYNNQNLNLSSSRPTVGAYWDGSSYPEVSTKRLGELYFSVDYVDFSVEANRLKFMDAFSNPVDLTTQITTGSIPTPMIYMRFDPNNKGKNYGSGGDFTTSGTINDFGQI